MSAMGIFHQLAYCYMWWEGGKSDAESVPVRSRRRVKIVANINTGFANSPKN